MSLLADFAGTTGPAMQALTNLQSSDAVNKLRAAQAQTIDLHNQMLHNQINFWKGSADPLAQMANNPPAPAQAPQGGQPFYKWGQPAGQPATNLAPANAPTNSPANTAGIGAASQAPSPTDQLQTLASHYMDMGQKAFSVGDGVDGMALTTQATKLMQLSATMQEKQATAANLRLEQVQKQAQIVGSALTGVYNQASYDSAIDSLQGEISPREYQMLKSHPFSPEFVAHLRGASMTVAQQAQEKLREETLAATETYRNSNLKLAALRTQIEATRAKIEAAREARLAKSAGAGVHTLAVPTSTAAGAALSFLQTQLPGIQPIDSSGHPTPEAQRTAVAITSAAQEYQKAHPGTTASAAIQEVTSELVENGSVVNKNGTPKLLMNGSTRFNPAPFPATPQQAKAGHWYIGRGGAIKQWTGTSWSD